LGKSHSCETPPRGDEHVLCSPRRQLGRVGLGGVELVEAETEELAPARSFEDDAAFADGV
jgi:hypothetical protein